MLEDDEHESGKSCLGVDDKADDDQADDDQAAAATPWPRDAVWLDTSAGSRAAAPLAPGDPPNSKTGSRSSLKGDDHEAADDKVAAAAAPGPRGAIRLDTKTREPDFPAKATSRSSPLAPGDAPAFKTKSSLKDDDHEANDDQAAVATPGPRDSVGLDTNTSSRAAPLGPGDAPTSDTGSYLPSGFAPSSARRLSQPGAYRVTRIPVLQETEQDLPPPPLRCYQQTPADDAHVVGQSWLVGDNGAATPGRDAVQLDESSSVGTMVSSAILLDDSNVTAIEDEDDVTTTEHGATKTTAKNPCDERRAKSLAFVSFVVVAVAVVIVVAVSLSVRGRGDGADNSTQPPPESEVFLRMRDVLVTISGTAALSDPSSPQHRALSWLAYEDTANLKMVYGSAGWEKRLIQRYIAATLLFSTECDQAVEAQCSADFALNVIMDGHECSWNAELSKFSWGLLGGISCTEAVGIVTEVYFGQAFRPLVGTIPEEIGHLPHLHRLVFSNNEKLVGTIPDSISSLTELEMLHLGSNKLSGTLPNPPFPGSADTLRFLAIAATSLSGTIPDAIGSLPKLSTLILPQNDLTGTIPDSITNLTELSVLALQSNELSGTIPSSLGLHQDYLVFVAMNNNALVGTFPSGLLTEGGPLLGVYLSTNNLSGTIPTELGSKANLTSLFLHSNAFSGTLPSSLGNCSNLEYLELGDNLLSGFVPTSFGNLANLDSLSLVGNDLTGDMNFLCKMSISNLLTDCSELNPDTVCECCSCCEDDLKCRQYPSTGSQAASAMAKECWMRTRCFGASDI